MSEIVEKVKGWFENPDPLCLNKKGESVAPKHHEIAINQIADEKKQWNKSNIVIPNQEKTVLVCVTMFHKEGIESAIMGINNHCINNGIRNRVSTDENTIYFDVPVSKIGDAIHFVTNSNISWKRIECE